MTVCPIALASGCKPVFRIRVLPGENHPWRLRDGSGSHE